MDLRLGHDGGNENSLGLGSTEEVVPRALVLMRKESNAGLNKHLMTGLSVGKRYSDVQYCDVRFIQPDRVNPYLGLVHVQVSTIVDAKMQMSAAFLMERLSFLPKHVAHRWLCIADCVGLGMCPFSQKEELFVS